MVKNTASVIRQLSLLFQIWVEEDPPRLFVRPEDLFLSALTAPDDLFIATCLGEKEDMARPYSPIYPQFIPARLSENAQDDSLTGFVPHKVPLPILAYSKID